MKKPYIIAETAYGFEGKSEYLLEQTRKLPKEIDAIKYHMLYDIDSYMSKDHSIYSLVKSWILSKEEWKEILKVANIKKHDVIILADDIESIEYLREVEKLVTGIEIHAACINDKKLLDEAIKFSNQYNKTLYLGISGFEIQELGDIIQYIKEKEVKDIVLMYGFQNYPTNIKEVNLRKIQAIKEMFDLKVGYADHTQFDDINKEQMITTAFILGANIQEIHYVLEEGKERIDYITAVSGERLVNLKRQLEKISDMIGNIEYRLNEGEKKYLNSRKVPVYTRDLEKGYILKEEDINFIRIDVPNYQHKFNEEELFIGKKLNYNVKCGKEIRKEDIEY